MTPLLASGRDADVFALDGDRVLRRYRDAAMRADDEGRVMRYLAERGYPVPRVHEAAGTDMVMDRLHGPTMLADLARRPWLSRRHGATLNALHRRLHAIGAPDWLGAHPTGGGKVLHLDLHPGNVILTASGPVVIDWCNAKAGDPAFDVAYTHVLMRTGEPDGLSAPAAAAVMAVRRLFLRGFLAGSAAASAHRLRDAIGQRLTDPNLRETEAAALRRWAARLDGSGRG